MITLRADTWLSQILRGEKMAMNFKQWSGILTMVLPLVLMLVPGGAALAPVASVILKGMLDAQAKVGATGPEKKAFVLALVNDATAGTELIKPHTIDPALTAQAAGQAIDAVITVVNAIQTAHAALPTVPALVAPAV